MMQSPPHMIDIEFTMNSNVTMEDSRPNQKTWWGTGILRTCAAIAIKHSKKQHNMEQQTYSYNIRSHCTTSRSTCLQVAHSSLLSLQEGSLFNGQLHTLHSQRMLIVSIGDKTSGNSFARILVWCETLSQRFASKKQEQTCMLWRWRWPSLAAPTGRPAVSA
eukprot:5533312-Amphidinium_carterae.1